MSVFLLPLEISRDIEMQMAKFWWKPSRSQRKGIHWISSDCLICHKSVGGIGFRSQCDFNLALLGKQGWHLLIRPHSLASKVFKARYFPSGCFLDATIGNNPSFFL